jgi:hypothetical protein
VGVGTMRTDEDAWVYRPRDRSLINSFSQVGSHPPAVRRKRFWSAFSLILARSLWTWRDVSSTGVHGLHEPLARLPPSFEVPIARKEEPGDADNWPARDNVDYLLHFFTLSPENNVDYSLHFFTFE